MTSHILSAIKCDFFERIERLWDFPFFTTVGLLTGCGSSNTIIGPTRTTATPATITFDGLAGSGSPVTEYDESGFNISSTSGNWEVMAEYGKPAPAIELKREANEPESQGEIEVSARGDVFRFSSVDLYSSITPIPHTINRYRDSNLLFTISDTVPNPSGNFVNIRNVHSSVLIDRLTISLSNPETPCCSNPVGIDNIRINQEMSPQNGGGSTTQGTGSTAMTSSGISGAAPATVQIPDPPG